MYLSMGESVISFMDMNIGWIVDVSGDANYSAVYETMKNGFSMSAIMGLGYIIL